MRISMYSICETGTPPCAAIRRASAAGTFACTWESTNAWVDPRSGRSKRVTYCPFARTPTDRRSPATISVNCASPGVRCRSSMSTFAPYRDRIARSARAKLALRNSDRGSVGLTLAGSNGGAGLAPVAVPVPAEVCVRVGPEDDVPLAEVGDVVLGVVRTLSATAEDSATAAATAPAQTSTATATRPNLIPPSELPKQLGLLAVELVFGQRAALAQLRELRDLVERILARRACTRRSRRRERRRERRSRRG